MNNCRIPSNLFSKLSAKWDTKYMAKTYRVNWNCQTHDALSEDAKMNKAKSSFLQIKVFSNYCKFGNLKAAEAIRSKVFAT